MKCNSILIISSLDPTIGPGVIAETAYNAFKKCGISTDLLTKYQVESRPQYKYVCDKQEKSFIANLFKNNSFLRRMYSLFEKDLKDMVFFIKKKANHQFP